MYLLQCLSFLICAVIVRRSVIGKDESFYLCLIVKEKKNYVLITADIFQWSSMNCPYEIRVILNINGNLKVFWEYPYHVDSYYGKSWESHCKKT